MIKAFKKFDLSVTKKSAFAYMIAECLSKGMNLITIPFFTRILSLEEMGLTTIFASFQIIAYPIATLSLSSGSVNSAMITFPERKSEYLSTILILSTLSSFIFSVIIIVLYHFFNIGILPIYLLPLLFCSFLLQPAMDLWYLKSRYENKYKTVLTISCISTISSSVFSIFFVWYFKKYTSINLGVVRLYSQNGVTFLFCFGLYIHILNSGKRIFNKTMWVFALKTSLPLIIHSLAKNILDISDRLMIAKYCGETYAGLYGTIHSISNIPLIVWNAINAAIIPYMFHSLKDEKSDLPDHLFRIILFFLFVVLLIILIAPEILLLLTDEKYHASVIIMPPLLLSIFLNSIYNLYGNYLLYKKKTQFIMYGTLIAVLLNIILNIIFIPVFGYVAASYTTLASVIVLCISQSIMTYFCYRKNVIKIRKIVTLILFSVVFGIIAPLLYMYVVVRVFVLLFIIVICLYFVKTIVKNKEV